MTGTRMRVTPKLTRGVAMAVVFILVVAVVLWWVFQGATTKRITAYFGAAVGVFEGSTVRVLGVEVGRIEKVQPQGGTVRVDMTIDKDVEVPEAAQAVVIAPSVVSDRYVQLAPAYTTGPRLADGAVIPRERTATPVELDEIYSSLDKLASALGPDGANSQGALNDLLNTSARNLRGNGQALSDTVRQLGEATKTLSGNRQDLFTTIDNLRSFTSMLAANDKQVRDFNTQLAEVTRFLAGERQDLSAALSELATALAQVQGFVRNNRDKLKSNVDKLASVTQVLVDQRAALAEILDVAPLTLGNLNNAYNGSSGTLDARADLNELAQPPIIMICKLVRQATPANLPKLLAETCDRLAPILDGTMKLPTAADVITSLQHGQLPPLPLPLVNQQGGGQ